jgi:ribokinase
MKSDTIAIGIGSLNFDYIYKVDTVATGDEQVVISDYHGSPGGSAANTIYALARLGIKTGFVGAVGVDVEGEQILSQMTEIGTDVTRIQKLKSELTSRVMVFVDNYGERAMYSLPAASTKLQISNNDIEYLKSVEFTIISAIPDNRYLELYKKIVTQIQHDTKIIFMPGALYSKTGHSILKEILNAAYSVILNRRELEEITQQPEYQDGAQWLVKSGCKNVVVTLGKSGAFIQNAKQQTVIPSPEVTQEKIIDTTGAGDAFAAGLIFGLTLDKPFNDAILIGNIMAGACIQGLGARGYIPDKDKILLEFNEYSERIKNG